MNDYYYECGMCDCAPCVCSEHKRKKNIREGKIVIESLLQAVIHLSKRRMKIVRWLWPDIIHVIADLKEYWEGL